MARQDIIVKLRLAGEDFDRDFKVKFQDLTDAAEKQSAQSGARAGSSFGKSFATGLGTAAGAAGAAIGLAINQASNLGAEIASTSRQFNIGVESLQVWRQAAATAGVSANDLNGAFGGLTQKIGEANAGNRAAQESFVALGIGFKDTAGQARATDAVMLDLAKRISDIQDPAERVRVGTQLLGDQFKSLYPLLLDGADGLQRASAELGQFGAVLTQEEIRNLEKTNAKIEQMKTVLSIRIASVVAENADSIIMFTSKLVDFSVAAIDAANAFLGLQSSFDRRVAGLPSNLSIPERDAAIRRIANDEGQRTAETIAQDGVGGRLWRLRDTSARAPARMQDYYTPGMRSDLQRWLAPPPAAVEAPRITGGGGARRTGGGGARNATQSAAEREAERAAKKAIDDEKAFRDAIARTLRAQQDSADIARIRAEQGEVAAARAEAELGILRQHPLAVNETVEAYAAALGITEKLTDERRKALQADIDAAKIVRGNAGNDAATKAKAELDREADRQKERNDDIADQAAARWQAAHEQAIFDVADIYETAFRGGTKDLWANFKDEGTRIIAEIAAEWTLAMIAGQPFNFNAAAGGAFGRSPIASIFGGAGGGIGAANDNGFGMPGVGGGVLGIGGNPTRFTRGGLLPSGAQNGLIPNGAGTGFNASLGSGAGFLQNPAFALGLGTLATSVFGNGSTGSQIGGLVGSIGGQALGSSLAALGSFGGPIGAIAGSILGSVLPSLLSGQRRGSATVGGIGGTLGVTGTRGNSRSREATASESAGSLIDAIFQIADQLGGSVDASRGRVSIGVRDNNFRVDGSGSGITRTRNGAVDFGSDQEAAIRFAVQDLIADGVITGISQASQNLLQRGGDLEAQIEKALLIEQIPKLLRQRFDPLGAAVDELFEKFKKVNEALVEGSASAEQFAQARQLWELEKADAIASIGAASQTLKDFLASLNAGSNSPLSLREQRAEAEAQLQPFLTQITSAESARAEAERVRSGGGSAAEIAAAEQAARTAAAAINQDGFTQASQLLLSISRQSNASSGAFFSDFDRIRALTGQAIGFVDQASPRDADPRDPFSQAIAQNTQDAAYILTDQFAEMRAQSETLRRIEAALSGGAGAGFIGADRAFVNAA